MWRSPRPGQPGRRAGPPKHGDRHRPGQPQEVSLTNAEGKGVDLVAGEEVANLQNPQGGDVVALADTCNRWI